MSRNKVRKLEFLMADAVEQQADTFITFALDGIDTTQLLDEAVLRLL